MKPQPSRLLLGGLSVLLPLAWLLPMPVALAEGGATFVVSVTVDGVDALPGDGLCATAQGECTLRAAVMEANELPSDDRIELGPNFYYLSIAGTDEEGAAMGDLDVYGSLTIVGQGMMATIIDAGGAATGDRGLHIHPGAAFTLDGVSVGYADIGAGANGAGLRNDSGDVTIRDSSFQFNRAHNGAGLMNVGNMRIEHSLIGYNIATDAGAGVRNDGTLEIDGSAIIENDVAAGPGAGIENHGTLTIRNSTISSNRAGSSGAAIYNGFGPNSGGASLTVNNATIYVNNVITGGGGGDVTGGIYNEPASSVEISNSIVARNAINYVEAVDCLGTITSRGYNLFSNLEGCAIDGDSSHDIVTADPKLGLYDLDPVGTISYPLELGSPALAAGNPAVPGSSVFACEPVDQRDVIRPQGLRCDIGAREMPADMEPPTVTPDPPPTATDTPTVTPTDTPTPTATSTITPTPAAGSLFFDGFETGDLLAWSSAQTDAGDLSALTEAAIEGAYGLRAVIDDNRAIYVVDTTAAGERTYAARFYFDPNGIAMASGNAHVIFKAKDAASRTAFQVELRSFQGDYQLRAQALSDSGSATSTPWFRLYDDVHAIETIWQAASADGARDGSLALWLDGGPVAASSGIDNDTLRVETVRLGAVAGIDNGTRGSYSFDAFGSTADGMIGPDPGITLPSPPPTPDAVFADGFESGDLSAWSAITNGTDLAVNSSAALGGGFGLAAIVDDTAPRYVSDWSPVSLKAYAARFYFDPNGITMASGNAHILFRAMDASSKTALQLEFRSFQGDYQMRAYAPWDSGGAYSSPWFRLSDDPHLLELNWQAATAEGAGDGWLNLSIDEEPVASGRDLDNDTRRVDKIDLGAVAGLDSGTSGAYYFDAFASTAGIPIGSDPGITLPTPPAPPDAIFANGFEDGGLSAWSARKNEGDLLVNTGSALAGGYGLEAIADDTAPRYVSDWSPVDEREYHVRFAFDPNSLAMLDGRSHVIFQALAGASKVVAQVELRYKSLNYELRSGILTDAGQWVNTSWWSIEDAPQVIELEWRSASDPAAADGRLVMWINELQSDVRDGIANGSQSVDLARLGLVAGIDAGTLGSMSFDAFESRRRSHIGLS